ncbi:hypothetical protein SAMD00019534_122590 [Acytostelium subglobosum LB1]|uniref:hypothetical protein n=1 Tax=Acytostelium subglobosum LB1 TaxID=1410327 RepID=UPI000644D50A|nr:hypothetical protein SAMD00019534_122590 [Acytostelium subglobosum LB1]GAM29083.1 hypothetical protein SAMD00019534_122590 [Acytostelium subglobosum LB1]|eukprot:XP_012747928.1 hypothetical protein SAMD00019534_122590 [Acytostelium subglobosum LB1]
MSGDRISFFTNNPFIVNSTTNTMDTISSSSSNKKLKIQHFSEPSFSSSSSSSFSTSPSSTSKLMDILNPATDDEYSNDTTSFQQFEPRVPRLSTSAIHIGNNSASNGSTLCYSPPSSPMDHRLPLTPSQLSANSNTNMVHQWMQELANIKKRENFLLESLKCVDAPRSQSPQQLQQQQQQQSADNKQYITIVRQPSEMVISNRYINPSPYMSVDSELLSRTSGQLTVQAKLTYHTSSHPVVAKQSEDRQDVLQGILSQDVDRSNGVVVFNKLKVCEVSSKHNHQSFCLEFTLYEQGQQLARATSSPFLVLSRSYKRKKDEDQSTDSDSQEPSSPHSVCSSSSDNEPVSPTQSSGADPNYIDITDLLVLPQKEAAARLGISESMLCKRFKECTRRKWPYRYLRKIDKVIKVLTLSSNGNEITKEEQANLEKLQRERVECLLPVRIRITGCLEKDDDIRSSGSPNQLVPQLPSKTSVTAVTLASQEDTAAATASASISSLLQSTASSHAPANSERDSLENILETLEMLKHNRH